MTESIVRTGQEEQPCKLATLRILLYGKPVLSTGHAVSELYLDDSYTDLLDQSDRPHHNNSNFDTILHNNQDPDNKEGKGSNNNISMDNLKEGDGEGNNMAELGELSKDLHSFKTNTGDNDNNSNSTKFVFDPSIDPVPNSTIFIYSTSISPQLKESLHALENPHAETLLSSSSVIVSSSTMGNNGLNKSGGEKSASNLSKAASKSRNFIKLNKARVSPIHLKTSTNQGQGQGQGQPQSQAQSPPQPQTSTNLKVLRTIGFDLRPSYMEPTTCFQIRNREQFLERCEKKGLMAPSPPRPVQSFPGHRRTSEDWSEFLYSHNRSDMISMSMSGKSSAPPLGRHSNNSDNNTRFVPVPLHVSARMKAQFALEKQLKTSKRRVLTTATTDGQSDFLDSGSDKDKDKEKTKNNNNTDNNDNVTAIKTTATPVPKATKARSITCDDDESIKTYFLSSSVMS